MDLFDSQPTRAPSAAMYGESGNNRDPDTTPGSIDPVPNCNSLRLGQGSLLCMHIHTYIHTYITNTLHSSATTALKIARDFISNRNYTCSYYLVYQAYQNTINKKYINSHY